MATILLAWELGGGLGHFMNLRPLAEGLSRRGHRVVAVLRDLSSARRMLTDPNVVCLQAPFKHQRISDIEPTCTFAQILHNCGFGEADELATLAEAWRELYKLFNPDLVVFDHSPTALLAARGFPARRALIGTGFFSPPDVTPLPNLRTWIQPDAAILRSHETHVLENINAALDRWREPPLESVAQLYHPIDEDFLLTFRELDCYPQRADSGSENRRGSSLPTVFPSTEEGLPTVSLPHGAEGAANASPFAPYWGAWSAGMGLPPQWPTGHGRKIFAYLKPFPSLTQLLTALCGLPNPSLIYAPGIDRRLRERCRSPNVRFTDAPVEMAQVARDCDLAILNGTHATTIAMLLAGKPALHIPLFLEQALNALAAERLGAAICIPSTEPGRILSAPRSLLTTDLVSRSAQAFAARYLDFHADRQIEILVNRAEELANESPPESN